MQPPIVDSISSLALPPFRCAVRSSSALCHCGVGWGQTPWMLFDVAHVTLVPGLSVGPEQRAGQPSKAMDAEQFEQTSQHFLASSSADDDFLALSGSQNLDCALSSRLRRPNRPLFGQLCRSWAPTLGQRSLVLVRFLSEQLGSIPDPTYPASRRDWCLASACHGQRILTE
ncbi:hypothetical protein BDP81DRAFT_414604 [Colletotrichum phormii]|uniref:Uncharacterized protein n=1 Tax=Colletotrichum phormii TaxID=359342 RepID=A0AAJ0A4H0_9PEZI|nr:uncharacterized protein BDP81DRAFT_414604 [Colletotrichum phormii]KAK1656322.1 hypothetical protein BDP81DRAFT_414604 [Colletotrichum phormii]